MSTKYKFRDQGQIYFITMTVVQWLDVFISKQCREILIESWKYCIEHKGLEIYGWCIMSSHVHMIVGSHKDRLQDIMRDMKKYTSYKIKAALIRKEPSSKRPWIGEVLKKAGRANGNNDNFQFWIQNNHPVVLETIEIAWQRLDYIHNNPVAAGIVFRPEDYVYSSAREYYYEMAGKVPLKRLSSPTG